MIVRNVRIKYCLALYLTLVEKAASHTVISLLRLIIAKKICSHANKVRAFNKFTMNHPSFDSLCLINLHFSLDTYMQMFEN